MAAYRISEFTLEQRLDTALRMLAPDRKWGLSTELARRHRVSRPLLYKTRDRVRDALIEALLPRPAGRPAHTTTLTVDRELVDQAIITLPLLKGTVRDIRLGLHLLLGVSRSVGCISQTLAAAGEQAQAHNLSIRIPLPILGEADEIFQGRQPCLKRSRPSLPATPGVGCRVKSARHCTLRTGAEAQVTLETAIVLLKELGHRDITALADDLQGSYPSCLRLWSGWSNT